MPLHMEGEEEEEDPPCVSGVSQCAGKCLSVCIMACP